jgi:8-oxo-dGTP pyrophosphatase MutT (NUDIX family)
MAQRAALKTLTKNLASRNRLSFTREKAAAVLLPLLTSPAGEISLLFTRRAAKISQGGQVAFPGGKVDDSDDDRVATALRETEEEIGVPASKIKILGCLDDIPNWDNSQSVTPVVGLVDESFTVEDMKPSKDEVANIFSVPLVDLEDETRWTTKEMTWKGAKMAQFYFDVREYKNAGKGEKLWGLTAYCTLGLLMEMQAGEKNGAGLVASQHLKLLEQYDRRLKMSSRELNDGEELKQKMRSESLEEK